MLWKCGCFCELLPPMCSEAWIGQISKLRTVNKCDWFCNCRRAFQEHVIVYLKKTIFSRVLSIHKGLTCRKTRDTVLDQTVFSSQTFPVLDLTLCTCANSTAVVRVLWNTPQCVTFGDDHAAWTSLRRRRIHPTLFCWWEATQMQVLRKHELVAPEVSHTSWSTPDPCFWAGSPHGEKYPQRGRVICTPLESAPYYRPSQTNIPKLCTLNKILPASSCLNQKKSTHQQLTELNTIFLGCGVHSPAPLVHYLESLLLCWEVEVSSVLSRGSHNARKGEHVWRCGPHTRRMCDGGQPDSRHKKSFVNLLCSSE